MKAKTVLRTYEDHLLKTLDTLNSDITCSSDPRSRVFVVVVEVDAKQEIL